MSLLPNYSNFHISYFNFSQKKLNRYPVLMTNIYFKPKCPFQILLIKLVLVGRKILLLKKKKTVINNLQGLKVITNKLHYVLA